MILPTGLMEGSNHTEIPTTNVTRIVVQTRNFNQPSCFDRNTTVYPLPFPLHCRKWNAIMKPVRSLVRLVYDWCKISLMDLRSFTSSDFRYQFYIINITQSKLSISKIERFFCLKYNTTNMSSLGFRCITGRSGPRENTRMPHMASRHGGTKAREDLWWNIPGYSRVCLLFGRGERKHDEKMAEDRCSGYI